MKIRSRFFIFFVCILNSLSFAQTPEIDSLLAVLKHPGEDTSRINTLNRLSESYWKKDLLDKAWISAQEAMSLSEKLSFTPGKIDAFISYTRVLSDQGETDKCISEGLKALRLAYSVNDKPHIIIALNTIGTTYYNQPDYPKAMEFFQKALKMEEQIADVRSMAKTASYIGLCYNNLGNYPMALEYDLRALKCNEELGNKKGLASSYMNIGVVHDAQGSVEKALDNYNKALTIAREIGYKKVVSFCLINMGGVYQKHGDRKEAFDFFNKALKELGDAGDQNGMAATLNNIGVLYEGTLQENSGRNKDSIVRKVLEYYGRSLDISREIGDQERIAMVQNNIGNVLAQQGKFEEAIRRCMESLKIAKEISSLNQVRETEKILAEIYRLKKDAPDELLHYKAYIAARDSLYNEENTKNAVRTEMNFEFTKKEALEKKEQEKKDLIAAEDLKHQKQISYAVVAGLIIVLVFSILLFNRFRLIRKQKEIIEVQKSIVDEKNKEILDSIHYAKRIQSSLLPTERYIEKKLKELNKKT